MIHPVFFPLLDSANNQVHNSFFNYMRGYLVIALLMNISEKS